MNIRYIFLLLFAASIYSCSNKGFEKIDDTKVVYPDIFTSNFRKGVYKTSFDFYNRKITGITVIKKSDSSFRMVSMSEIGLKYFDLEFFTNNFKKPKVHYVMDVLNRKMLLKRLTFDLNLLFNFPHQDLKISKANKNIFKSGKYVYGKSSIVDGVYKSSCLGAKSPLIELKYSGSDYPYYIEIRRSNIIIIFEEINNTN